MHGKNRIEFDTMVKNYWLRQQHVVIGKSKQQKRSAKHPIQCMKEPRNL